LHILGISAFYHDSAAALIADGRIVAAAQEERFSRKKHDARFPTHAVIYCLREAGVRLSELDYVTFYEKPFLKFDRLLETYCAVAPRGFRSFRTAMPLWLRSKLFQRNLLCKELRKLDGQFDCTAKLLFSEHHQSHAASAFFPSPFSKAVVLTMDGVGEWATCSVALGNDNRLDISKELHFPHSLGLLYSAFTHYLGFRVNSGEYKVMGLAPYGEPVYAKTILEKLIDLKPDGSFRLDQSYFSYCTGLTMTSSRFHDLFGAPARQPESELAQRHMDLAASVQAVTNEVVLRVTRGLAKETGVENLCLAGGVALNCVANGAILRDGRFKNVWIQPAAGDAGGALGAAYCAYYLHEGKARSHSGDLDEMQGAYLGPAFGQYDTETRLVSRGARFTKLEDDLLIEEAARALAAGKAVGWFQGRMEFGPRALGARSILGDARSPHMQRILNLKIKFRESFRPFAPSVLREDVADWFALDTDSQYMLLVAPVLERHRDAMSELEQELFGIDKLNVARSDVPAVTHVDYSARIQTVHRETNSRYHALISRFKDLTGCPVIINTSFNIRGEPIVCTPEEAFTCFMATEIDRLVIGNCFLCKEDQDLSLRRDYRSAVELD
jgi:carbamoyltransferase